MKNDTISNQVRNPHNPTGKTGQDLRKLGDTRISTDRPVPVMQPQRVSYVGGQTLKIRCPDIGETALSASEIDIAISEGITAL